MSAFINKDRGMGLFTGVKEKNKQMIFNYFNLAKKEKKTI